MLDTHFVRLFYRTIPMLRIHFCSVILCSQFASELSLENNYQDNTLGSMVILFAHFIVN